MMNAPRLSYVSYVLCGVTFNSDVVKNPSFGGLFGNGLCARVGVPWSFATERSQGNPKPQVGKRASPRCKARAIHV
eukprot:1701281-Heterocapsa_arctica.AAC.1